MSARRASAAVALLALTFGARPSHAEQRCNAARSVDLTIELEPPNAAIAERLERQLVAELRARHLEVCRARPGEPVLAHIRWHSGEPDLRRVSISIQLAAGSGSEPLAGEPAAESQALDLRALPTDARPLAVASTTDELLRALLAASPRLEPRPEARQPVVSDASDTLQRPAPVPAPTPARPHLELGAAGVGSTFFGHRVAWGGDVLGRWWPAPRLSTTLRIGSMIAFEQSSELGSVRANDVHGSVGLGYSLLPAPAALGLSAAAALGVARVSFQVTPAGEAVARPGSSWATLASAGAEGWWRAGALCFSVGLAALFPLWPVYATAGSADITSLAGIGAEVTAGVWFLLDGAPP